MIVLGLYDKDGSDPDLQVFLDAFQVSFPILVDAHQTYFTYRQTGATSPYPLDYVIDQTGHIAYIGTEYDPETMADVIDELLLHPASAGDLPDVVNHLKLEARPNPFNPRTEIRFQLPGAGRIDLDIHDARGHLGDVGESGPRVGRHLP